MALLKTTFYSHHFSYSSYSFLGTELFLISFCSWDVCATLHRPLFLCSFLFSHNCGRSMEKVCFFTFVTCFTKCLHMGMYAFAHTLESVLSRFTSLKECISRILYAQYAGKLPECSFYATAPSSNIKGFTPHSVPFVWVGGQKGTHQHGHCRDFSNIGSLKGTLLLILLQNNLIFDQKPFSVYLLGIFPLFIDPGARKCLPIFSSCFKFS